MSIIKNAKITKVELGMNDRDIYTFTWWLDYVGTSQGWGGYNLNNPKVNPELIPKLLRAAGVHDWSELKGKYIRVQSDHDFLNSKIEKVGHIIEDIWVDPITDFYVAI